MRSVFPSSTNRTCGCSPSLAFSLEMALTSVFRSLLQELHAGYAAPSGLLARKRQCLARSGLQSQLHAEVPEVLDHRRIGSRPVGLEPPLGVLVDARIRIPPARHLPDLLLLDLGEELRERRLVDLVRRAVEDVEEDDEEQHHDACEHDGDLGHPVPEDHVEKQEHQQRHPLLVLLFLYVVFWDRMPKVAIVLTGVVVLFFVVFFHIFNRSADEIDEPSFTQFLTKVEQKKIREVTSRRNSYSGVYEDTKGRFQTYGPTPDPAVVQNLRDLGVQLRLEPASR